MLPQSGNIPWPVCQSVLLTLVTCCSSDQSSHCIWVSQSQHTCHSAPFLWCGTCLFSPCAQTLKTPHTNPEDNDYVIPECPQPHHLCLSHVSTFLYVAKELTAYRSLLNSPRREIITDTILGAEEWTWQCVSGSDYLPRVIIWISRPWNPASAGPWQVRFLRLDSLCHLPNSSSGVLQASANITAESIGESSEIATAYSLWEILSA